MIARRFVRLGTLLFILLVILVLAVLLGAGGYSVRRDWSPAGAENVEKSGDTGGAGAGIAAPRLSLLGLILRFFCLQPWGSFWPAHSATDARHVRNAIARFDQVEGVSDAERDAAWRRIRAAARKYGVEVSARGWRQLMKGGRTARSRSRSR